MRARPPLLRFDRTWSALTRLRAGVGAAGFRDLMVDLPDALDETGNPDLGGISDFHDLLGRDDFRAFLAEVTDAFEVGSDPGVLWAKWLHRAAKGQPDSPRSLA